MRFLEGAAAFMLIDILFTTLFLGKHHGLT